MASKFFESFQTKADALKKTRTRWIDEADSTNYPSSQAYIHNDAQSSEHDAASDEDDVELPKARFTPGLFKPGNKVDSQASSSVFANRPISAILRSNNQKDIKALASKPSTSVPKLRAPEQQPTHQDLSAVLTKLTLMESRIMSLVESKILSLERKIEASDKLSISITKTVESISATIDDHAANSLRAYREDLVQVMNAINECTQQSGSVLADHIEEVNKRISSTSNHAVPNGADDGVQINNNEVVVITANNPHDTVHRISADELVSIAEGSTVYVCSSLDDLKRDLSIVREADIIEEQEAVAEET